MSKQSRKGKTTTKKASDTQLSVEAPASSQLLVPIPQSDEERDQRFDTLHEVVVRFAKDSVDVMDALFEIREARLYEGKFKTWEDYCESIHQITRQYGNRLATAGRTRKEMETIVSTRNLPLPENEAQLRELARVADVEERVNVYAKARERAKGQVTAKAIREFVPVGTPPKGKRPSPSSKLKEVKKLLPDLRASLDDKDKLVELIGKLEQLFAKKGKGKSKAS